MIRRSNPSIIKLLSKALNPLCSTGTISRLPLHSDSTNFALLNWVNHVKILMRMSNQRHWEKKREKTLTETVGQDAKHCAERLNSQLCFYALFLLQVPAITNTPTQLCLLSHLYSSVQYFYQGRTQPMLPLIGALSELLQHVLTCQPIVWLPCLVIWYQLHS